MLILARKYERPTKKNQENINTYIDILKYYGFEREMSCLLERSNNIEHAIIVFEHTLDRASSKITDESHLEYIQKYKREFLSYFIGDEKIIMRIDPSKKVSIPSDNLEHIHQSCHVNSCLNVISSMNHLMLAILKQKDCSREFDLLQGLLVNLYSNPRKFLEYLMRFSDAAGIDIKVQWESADTFKKILKIIYEKIPKTIIFYWDTSDEFSTDEEKKLDVHQMIKKYVPKYYVCNVQDFNVVMGIESEEVSILEFEIGHVKYQLTAVVSHIRSHYFSAFTTERGFIIRDDLYTGCMKDKTYTNISDYRGKVVNTYAYYIRI